MPLLALATPALAQMDVYILAGQSQMAGRGRLEDAPALSADRVFKFWTNDTWEAAAEPVHWDGGRAGFGPGLAFGRAMADASPGRDVGLVPCAVGGSSISSWLPGKVNYTNALAKAKRAMASGRLRGIIWHQGEADSWKAATAEIHGGRLRLVVESFRRDLGIPDLPFVAGEVAGFYADSIVKRGGTPFVDVVNAQSRSAMAGLPQCGYVTVEGLCHGSRGDIVHFEPDSAAELGRRYAAEMLRLIGSAESGGRVTAFGRGKGRVAQ